MMNPQNLQYSFMFKIATSFILLMNLARSSASSTPSMYERCKPVRCEKGPNITYPYYLDGNQSESCGYPSFKVQCQGGYPTGFGYIIRSISDYGTSATLVNNVTLNETCPVPLTTPSDDSTMFLKLDNSTDEIAFLCFFYNCSAPPPENATEVSCRSGTGIGSGRGTKSFVGLSSDQSCDKLNWSGTHSCKSVVVAPVEVKDMMQQQKLSMMDHFTEGVEYVKLLEGGFTVRMRWEESGCKRCQSSGGRCGYDKTHTRSVCHCPDRTHLTHCRKGNKHMQIVLGVGIGLAVIVLIVLSIYMFRHRRKYKSTLSQNSSAEDSFGGSNVYFEVPIFSNDELEQATNNFDSSKELGDGGYGTVYYGKLRDGREVAVKRLYEHNYRRVKQFMTEVQILTRLRHTNLVSLYGCTSRRSRELLLVYEYVANGTVADHLHGDRAKPGSFPWPLRMNIAVETAKALAYLHKEGIIHRDVKTNNILLDKNFSVKVGDFGISRLRPTDVTHVSTAPQGTPGYVDPEYHLCYQLTEKSDVYSFGVVLVELVSSMPAVDISRDRHEINLANLAVNKIQKRALDELIDPNLNCESDDKIKNMVTAVIELSFRCLQQDRELRPTMDEVVEELENAVESGRVAESRDPISRSNVSVDSGKAKTTGFLTSPESDEARLLNKVKFSSSPISVITQNWTSSSSSSINSKSTLSTL